MSRSYVVKQDVPEGMQRPSCSKPIRRAAQTEQGHGAENHNLQQLDWHPNLTRTYQFPTQKGKSEVCPSAINKKITSRERPIISLMNRDSKNAGTITATAAKVAPSISTGTISSVLGSGIAR